MGVEIERKFLVQGEGWRSLGTSELFIQGYISRTVGRVVRVRLVGDKGYLTIKGKNVGMQLPEFEYEIPAADARELLDTLAEKPLLHKKRHRIPFAGFMWEVDEFAGENQGLVVAEIELPSPDSVFEKPEWIGEEVTGIARYYNSNLCEFPYCRW